MENKTGEVKPEETISSPSLRFRAGEQRGSLLLGDLIAAGIALFLALYLWSAGREWLTFSPEFLRARVALWFYFLPLVWIVLLVESYAGRRPITKKESFIEVLIAAGLSLVLYLLVFFVASKSLPRLAVIYFIVFASILTLLWRSLFVSIFTASAENRRALILGAGKAGSEIARILSKLEKPPFKTVGFLDDGAGKQGEEISGVKVIGTCADFWAVVKEQQVTDIILAIIGEIRVDLLDVLMEAEERGIEVTSMPALYEELRGRIPIFMLRSDWAVRSFIDQSHTSALYELIKRLLDIVGGLIGSIITLVLVPIFGTLIVADTGFPIFYSQTRLGRAGRNYEMFKFRTMMQDAEIDGVARPADRNDTRVTKIGRFLRLTHLDELPQFFNILIGEMSLVGPRAERPEIAEDFFKTIPFYKARNLVKPGLTGWAQVNYEYAHGIEMNATKLEYDLFYIKNRNLLLDFSIILRTIWTVIGFKGN